MPQHDDNVQVVWVDPGDEKDSITRREAYWWPALIVPRVERDGKMGMRTPGSFTVAYFEGDFKFLYASSHGSNCLKPGELRVFSPELEPFTSFSRIPKFGDDPWVKQALHFLETGEFPNPKFRWKKWGLAAKKEETRLLVEKKKRALAVNALVDELVSLVMDQVVKGDDRSVSDNNENVFPQVQVVDGEKVSSVAVMEGVQEVI